MTLSEIGMAVCDDNVANVTRLLTACGCTSDEIDDTLMCQPLCAKLLFVDYQFDCLENDSYNWRAVEDIITTMCDMLETEYGHAHGMFHKIICQARCDVGC